MLRLLAVLLLCTSLLGCRDREAALPKPGTIVAHRDSGDRYQVTWSGISTYNEGACPVNRQCIHLRRTVDSDNRVEVAVTMDEYSQTYRQVTP